MKLGWTRAAITLALAAALGLTALASAGVITPEEWADLDGSGVVDAADLQIVAADLGRSVPPADPRADLDGSGAMNVMDLSMVAALLGRQVPVETVVFPDANLEAAVRGGPGIARGGHHPPAPPGAYGFVRPWKGDQGPHRSPARHQSGLP